MLYKEEQAIKILEKQYNKKLSDIGRETAKILGIVFNGIYHMPETTLLNTEWSDPYGIHVNIRTELATYDFAELTWLVVLCHDRAIRLGVDACNMQYFTLSFHQRDPNGDSIMNRHPTIEETIKNVREEIKDNIVFREKKHEKM